MYKRRSIKEADFITVRDFLVETKQANPNLHNWDIDRWEFCRCVSQGVIVWLLDMRRCFNSIQTLQNHGRPSPGKV